MSDDPVQFNPPDPVSGDPVLPSSDPRARRMLGELQSELGRAVRRRHRRRFALRAAAVLVVGIGAALLALKPGVPAPSPQQTALVPSPVQPPQSTPEPERTLAAAPTPHERIPDCTRDAHGAPSALDGVCLLSDEQLIAVLAEQSGESYGVIRVGHEVRVIKNIQ